MIELLTKEACSGPIANLLDIRTHWCLAGSLTKSASLNGERQGILKGVDAHPPFRTLVEHK